MTKEKFQLRYSPVENRILIIVTDEVGQDEVFGLSRRLVKHLVPSVEKVLKASGHLVEPPMPDTQNPAPAPTPTESLAFEYRQQSDVGTAPAPGNPDKTPPAAEDDKPAHRAPRQACASSTGYNGVHVLHMTDGRRHLNVPLTDESLTQFSHGSSAFSATPTGIWNPSTSARANPRPRPQKLTSRRGARPNIANDPAHPSLGHPGRRLSRQTLGSPSSVRTQLRDCHAPS